jgi:hypothetical protein
MLVTIVALALALAPFAVITALLVIAARVRRTREGAVARQIALTDAVYREFGPVVAPTVTKPIVGPWQVEIPVPFRRAEVVGGVLSLVHSTLASMDRPASERVRIVLTPQEDAPPTRAHAA